MVDVISGYIKVQKAGMNFKARCPFHNEKTPSFYISPERQIWHCFGCFPPGQKIKTPFGFHNIEDIPEDHFVVSGKGLIRKVLATHKRDFRGNLVDVKVRKLGEAVTLTEDHNIFVVRPLAKYLGRGKYFYRRYNRYLKYYLDSPDKYFKKVQRYMPLVEISAGELKKGDFVLYPINKSINEIDQINLKDYLAKKYTFGPRPPEIPYKISVSDDFLKLLGYWIAEGSNHRAYIRFSLGNHEEDFAQEIVSLVKKVFNIDASIHRRSKYQNRTGLEITACHAYLADIFENLCSKGAGNKHIPFIFQELPSEKQKVLLDAIFRGDGHSFIANRSTKTHKSITTISRVLAEQLVDILLRSGLYPSLRTGKEHTDKKGVHHREAYSVYWSEEARSQHKCLYYQPDGTQYWLLPISDIQKKSYQGPVYNLTVEEDHSYVTTNFVVSNCGKGGDIFGFVKQMEGVEFPEALRILAQRAGVKLESYDPALQDTKAVLYDICETSTRFFEKQLHHSPAGSQALAYLKDRGLAESTIKEFRLGFAPEGWHNLGQFLRDCGFKDKDIIDSGMTIKREGGFDMHDRFRSRIIFPIADVNDQVAGFTGRIFEFEDARRSTQIDTQINADKIGVNQRWISVNQRESVAAKYINSPQTLIYDKSRILYGLNKAKTEARQADRCLLVEGNMDVIMSYQAGVRNTAATSGTALTPSHLQLLQRYTSNLDLCFDTDQAGLTATRRGIGLALSQNFNIKIVRIDDPECKDPADYVKKFGNKWQELTQTAKPVIDFYFDKLKSELDLASVDGKKAVIASLGPLIKRLASKVERSHWISRLAIALKTKEEAIESDVMTVKDDLESYEAYGTAGLESKPPLKNNEPAHPEDSLSQAILAVLLKKPEIFRDRLKDMNIADLDLLAGEAILKLKNSDLDDFNFGKFVKEFDRDTALKLEFAYLRSQEMLKDFNDDDLKNELDKLVNKLGHRSVTAQLAGLEFDIKTAEEAKDKGNMSLLLAKFSELTKKLIK